MNTSQGCYTASEVMPLFLPLRLYLKPHAKILITVELPHFKKLIGKSVSTLQLLEKIKNLIHPNQFVSVKVVTSTISIIEFEADIDVRAKLKDVLQKLDNKVLQLKDLKHLFKVRASEWKQNFPCQETWDNFFFDSKEMDETKPGERPDTIHVSGLPIKWFTRTANDRLPSEKDFFQVFEQFGKIRKVDIPICDPYRSKMKKHLTGMTTHTFQEKELFEGYVQFDDYSGFIKAMDAFRGMKLLHKQDNTIDVVEIKVDFDKSKHMSLGSVKRREILRNRLAQVDREKDTVINKSQESRQTKKDPPTDKEARKRLREERRKAKLLSQMQDKGLDEMNEKIAREERKILKAQRMLESIRLVETLFKRLKNVKFKRQNIHDVIKEKRKLMQTIKWDCDSSTTSSEHEERDESSDTMSGTRKGTAVPVPLTATAYISDPIWGCQPLSCGSAMQSCSLPCRVHFQRHNYNPRSGYRRGRGFSNHRWFRGPHHHFGQKVLHDYPLLQQEEYVKYFSKFLYDKDKRYRSDRRDSRSRSRSLSRRRSSSRSRRSRSSSRSYHSRSRSRERSSRRSRSKSPRRSRTRSRNSSKRRCSTRRSRS